MGDGEKFTGLLDLSDNPNRDNAIPAAVYDLNIDRIINRINLLWGENVNSFLYFPADADSEQYRREIYCDFRYFRRNETDDRLFLLFKDFSEKMKEVLRHDANRREGTISLQNAVWNVDEACLYCGLVETLHRELALLVKKGILKSDGLRRLTAFLEEYSESDEFKEMLQKSEEILNGLSRIELEIKYENNRIDVAVHKAGSGACQDGGEGLEGILRRIREDNPEKLSAPFEDTVELLLLEQEILSRAVKTESALFKQVELFDRKYEDYVARELINLAEELPFYLAYYVFEKDMEQKGFHFSSPSVSETERIHANGLYDLALACTRDIDSVVSNDFYYDSGERFFVLTGPNQGGKTTFARSLGQLIFFGKLGLDVPADSANIHYFRDILTHFSVEESIESGRGKLKEELLRLAPMMKKEQSGAFVIINELFTTAANYDAKIMGTNVLRHFIADECMGIYVTHLKELCDADEHVSAISAMLDENGRQNYKITRENVEYADCAANQVAKHRLSYEILVERLKKSQEGVKE